MSSVVQRLAWSAAWKGYVEGPKANQEPFSQMAHLLPTGQPWCAKHRVAGDLSCGVPIPPGGGTASTLANYQAYRRAGLLVPLADLQPGDIVWEGFASFLATREHGVGHEMLVRERLSGTRFTTWEGNSNAVGDRTGGEVCSLTRDYAIKGTSWIVAAARPQHDGRTVDWLNLPDPVASPAHTHLVLGTPIADVSHQLTPTATQTGKLVADGQLGAKTIAALQRALGFTGSAVDGRIVDTDTDGSATVRALQQLLNARIRAGLKVDGKGLRQDGRPYATVGALQAYLGHKVDRVLSEPVSATVMGLQERLNAATFAGGTVAA